MPRSACKRSMIDISLFRREGRRAGTPGGAPRQHHQSARRHGRPDAQARRELKQAPATTSKLPATLIEAEALAYARDHVRAIRDEKITFIGGLTLSWFAAADNRRSAGQRIEGAATQPLFLLDCVSSRRRLGPRPRGRARADRRLFVRAARPCRPPLATYNMELADPRNGGPAAWARQNQPTRICATSPLSSSSAPQAGNSGRPACGRPARFYPHAKSSARLARQRPLRHLPSPSVSPSPRRRFVRVWTKFGGSPFLTLRPAPARSNLRYSNARQHYCYDIPLKRG